MQCKFSQINLVEHCSWLTYLLQIGQDRSNPLQQKVPLALIRLDTELCKTVFRPNIRIVQNLAKITLPKYLAICNMYRYAVPSINHQYYYSIFIRATGWCLQCVSNMLKNRPGLCIWGRGCQPVTTRVGSSSQTKQTGVNHIIMNQFMRWGAGGDLISDGAQVLQPL